MSFPFRSPAPPHTRAHIAHALLPPSFPGAANEDKYIPRAMDLMPTLPHHPAIMRTCNLFIAVYVHWLSEHPSYVGPIVKVVISTLRSVAGSVDGESAGPVACAFLRLPDCAIHKFCAPTSDWEGADCKARQFCLPFPKTAACRKRRLCLRCATRKTMSRPWPL